MSIDDEIELEHLLFFDRKCRVCGKVKSLMDDFYLTRKNKKTFRIICFFDANRHTSGYKNKMEGIVKIIKAHVLWKGMMVRLLLALY